MTTGVVVTFRLVDPVRRTSGTCRTCGEEIPASLGYVAEHLGELVRFGCRVCLERFQIGLDQATGTVEVDPGSCEYCRGAEAIIAVSEWSYY